MTRRKWLYGAAALAVIVGAFFVRDLWFDRSRAVSGGPAPRAVPVEVAKAARKQVPYRIEALGTVTPMASVALKARLETTIVGVHFQDGARVAQGDPLFTLDCRQIEADIKRVQAIIDGAEASLTQAQRDVSRYSELAARNATPVVTLNNAQTAVNVSRATAESNRAQLENLNVQRGFCNIRAPIAGRISMANVKVGNFVRQADTAPMATIIQTTPVYVTFTVSQKELPDIRKALAAETATVEARIPGENQHVDGQVSMIENTVDATTGMATIRATMRNQNEALWPGTLVTTELTLRNEEAVVVPTDAVQVSQAGSIVFVVENGVAKVRKVETGRQVDSDTVIESGLKDGETVVTEGHLRLSNGARVSIRQPKAAAGS
ncbi:MAG: efflux RND transporter periplasmic adaptor subunit [Xanthobacteraceae bacterium]|uniref:efflux RND transporter periplasmic adaptor subunit n=1 Tax=Pseudolabrys sp. TaxID=1960880 RepID=UPI003D1077DF